MREPDPEDTPPPPFDSLTPSEQAKKIEQDQKYGELLEQQRHFRSSNGDLNLLTKIFSTLKRHNKTMDIIVIDIAAIDGDGEEEGRDWVYNEEAIVNATSEGLFPAEEDEARPVNIVIKALALSALSVGNFVLDPHNSGCMMSSFGADNIVTYSQHVFARLKRCYLTFGTAFGHLEETALIMDQTLELFIASPMLEGLTLNLCGLVKPDDNLDRTCHISKFWTLKFLTLRALCVRQFQMDIDDLLKFLQRNPSLESISIDRSHFMSQSPSGASLLRATEPVSVPEHDEAVAGLIKRNTGITGLKNVRVYDCTVGGWEEAADAWWKQVEDI